MTWTDVYLLCFIVGFSLSVLSFPGGATHIHLPFRLHWPFQSGHHTGGMAGRGTFDAPGGLGGVNAPTILTFLAWFGGSGYLVSTHSPLGGVVASGIALLSGPLPAGGGVQL